MLSLHVCYTKRAARSPGKPGGNRAYAFFCCTSVARFCATDFAFRASITGMTADSSYRYSGLVFHRVGNLDIAGIVLISPTLKTSLPMPVGQPRAY